MATQTTPRKRRPPAPAKAVPAEAPAPAGGAHIPSALAGGANPQSAPMGGANDRPAPPAEAARRRSRSRSATHEAASAAPAAPGSTASTEAGPAARAPRRRQRNGAAVDAAVANPAAAAAAQSETPGIAPDKAPDLPPGPPPGASTRRRRPAGPAAADAPAAEAARPRKRGRPASAAPAPDATVPVTGAPAPTAHPDTTADGIGRAEALKPAADLPAAKAGDDAPSVAAESGAEVAAGAGAQTASAAGDAQVAAGATADATADRTADRTADGSAEAAATVTAEVTAEVLALLSPPAAPAADGAPESAPNSAPDSADHSAGDNSGDSADVASMPIAAPAPAPEPETPPPPPPPPRPNPLVEVTSGRDESVLELLDGPRRRLLWRTGRRWPQRLAAPLRRLLDDDGSLPPEADADLADLLRQAAEAGHRIEVAPQVWPLLAAHRDARSRCARLAEAHPQGPGSAALRSLLSVRLAPFQAEGALWAVAAGRALLADPPGTGKGVQALAAVRLWQRHFGLARVLVVAEATALADWRHACRRLAGLQAESLGAAAPAGTAPAAPPPGDATGLAVRLVAARDLDAQAASIERWAAELVIVDEPQRLGLAPAHWARLAAAPHALVLSGAALERDPALVARIVDWLDPQRLGPWAALEQVRAARDSGEPLDEPALDAISAELSRVMLQRQPEELQGQLPPVLLRAHWVEPPPPAAGEGDAGVAALQRIGQRVQRWQASGHLSDADQWQLSQDLVLLTEAGRRSPAQDGATGLAPALLAGVRQAVASALADLEAMDQDDASLSEGDGATAEPPMAAPSASAAGTAAAAPLVLLLAPGEADVAQLQQALGPDGARCRVLPASALDRPARAAAALAEGWPPVGAVVQVGTPWSLPQRAWPPQAADLGALSPQRWTVVGLQDGWDQALWDSAGARNGAPRGPAEPGGTGFLAGAARQAWLAAIAAALAALV